MTMKLSEAIREGGKRYEGRQTREAMFDYDSTQLRVSALGAVVDYLAPDMMQGWQEAISETSGSWANVVDMDAVVTLIEDRCGVNIRKTTVLSLRGRPTDVEYFITFLNDKNACTFDQIADELEERGL